MKISVPLIDKTFLNVEIADTIEDAEKSARWLTQEPKTMASIPFATIEGDEKLKKRFIESCNTYVREMGNDPHDAILGLRGIVNNADTLLRARHIYDVPKLKVPAIAIGCGPSLAKHIPMLRKLQHSCLLVAADTAVKGLREEGIEPHICCPLERADDLGEYLPRDFGNCTYAGTIFVHSGLVNRFKSHLLVPQNVCFDRWIGERGVPYGDSTGTLCVSVAATLTTGDVYLVGHDLCFDGTESHWGKATSAKMPAADTEVMGNDGAMHPTNYQLRHFLTNMSIICLTRNNVYNVNAVDKVGALIPGVGGRPLPEPGEAFTWICPPADNTARLKRFKAGMERMDRDIKKARKNISKMKDGEGMMLDSIVKGQNQPAFEIMLRPLFMQIAIERRMGMPVEKLFNLFREAATNVLLNMRKYLDEPIGPDIALDETGEKREMWGAQQMTLMKPDEWQHVASLAAALKELKESVWSENNDLLSIGVDYILNCQMLRMRYFGGDSHWDDYEPRALVTAAYYACGVRPDFVPPLLCQAVIKAVKLGDAKCATAVRGFIDQHLSEIVKAA